MACHGLPSMTPVAWAPAATAMLMTNSANAGRNSRPHATSSPPKNSATAAMKPQKAGRKPMPSSASSVWPYCTHVSTPSVSLPQPCAKAMEHPMPTRNSSRPRSR
jgi:hypothetical protein